MNITDRAQFRADVARWDDARTLADLGQLTAAWLLRDGITYHPGYGDWESDDPGPDDETTEILAPLVAANRNGYVTTCSQPGLIRASGHDGSRWDQRAAVTGYTTIPTRDRLRDRLPLHRLIVIDQPLLIHPWQRYTHRAAVTWRNEQEHTWFGHRSSLLDILQEFQSRSWRLNMRLAAARQVTIVDPVIGRNDLLWPLLSDLGGPS